MMMSAIDYALLIPIIPIVAFPVILFIGQMFNGMPSWRKAWKEGGTIAVVVLGVVLGLSLSLISGYIGAVSGWDAGNANGDVSAHSATESNDDAVSANVGEYDSWINFHITDGDNLISESFGFGIYLDHASVMLLFVASFLCLMIGIFSLGYMNTDEINLDRNHRFYAEFLLFSAGMFGMVLADDFLWLFIFWEIMGLCSYLLIGFYYDKPSAAYAAKKAFLTTRVGDVFLFIGLLMMWNLFNSLEFATVWSDAAIAQVVADGNQGQLHLALGMMFIGAVGKSAQFPLHVWLPDAMEGPTPVSALIHAATMVNAGLYLVVRMIPFFANDQLAGDLSTLALTIAWIGGFTAVFAALIAFVQKDIKKVLAYSTMSQLAYIFTGLGAAAWLLNNGHTTAGLFAFGASLFHLFNHAMAKGMLFMASGSVIHEMHHAHHKINHSHGDHDDGHHEEDHFDAQDMTNMGGLAGKMPITATAMAVGSMSIIGIPLIGGFWSKEGIIASTWKAALTEGGFLLIGPALLLLIGAGMTGFYMSRMWFMTFAGKANTPVADEVVEDTPFIPIPLVILTFMTLGAIILASMHFIGWASEGFGHLSLDIVSGLVHELKHAFLPGGDDSVSSILFLVTMLTIFLSMIVGPFTAMALYGGRLDAYKVKPWLQWLIRLSHKVNSRSHFDNTAWAESSLAEALDKRLYIDDFYDNICEKWIVVPFANICAWFDRRVIDGAVKGIEYGSQETSTYIRSLTTGSARDYIMMAVLGIFAIFLLIWGVA
jgi:NADH-quinone oxidoreductase subunit L